MAVKIIGEPDFIIEQLSDEQQLVYNTVIVIGIRKYPGDPYDHDKKHDEEYPCATNVRRLIGI